MRNKLTDLLHHRRLTQMELAIETDTIACECLRQHIKQLDTDISAAVKAEADAATVGGSFAAYEAARDADIAADELEETTQVIPVCSMADLVWGADE